MQTVTKPRRKSRRRLTDDERRERNENSLISASRTAPNSNDLPVIAEFGLRGIEAEDCHTFGWNQNVFTYNAWQAQDRQVRKGEKSVRCTVWIPVVVKGRPESNIERLRKDHTRSRMSTACLFHITQTDQIGGVV